jgi:glycosyltransferase involved in cell wall biosynthesis
VNVAIFASAFHPSLGGVEELCRQLAHALVARGDRPMVLTNRWPKTLPERESYEGLPVHRYAFRVPERTWRQRGGAMLYGPGTARQVRADLRAHGADVLHVQCVSSNAYYALMAKRRLGLPLVVTLQGELSMDATGLFQRSAFARSLMRAALEQADAVTACSGQTLAEAEAFLGRPFGGRGRVIYNGIKLADFASARAFEHPRPYVLAIGRHVPQKGFDVLLRAFTELVRGGETSHDLVLAGDGAERANLEALAGELGVSGRVRFVGRVGREEAVGLFAGCSFFVLPSRHEPMGIVNLEAMAAGKAVVASRVGGVPELVADGKTGLLVAGGEVGALAAAMGRMIRDEGLRCSLGRAGRERAEMFDWAALAGEYEDVYRRVVGQKGAAA